MPPLDPSDLDHVLATAGTIWDDLRGTRLFVTGGSGFFGRWLLESLTHADDRLSLGVEAVVLTRDPAAFAAAAPHLAAHRAIRLHEGDVRSFTGPPGPFEHVLHAATVPTPPADSWTVLDTVISGTRRTLDFAESSGTRRFLFVSSGAVYGRQPAGVSHLPEDFAGGPDPVDPASANAEGKRAGELMAVIAGGRSGFATTVARGFACLGPLLPLSGQFAAGNFLRDALAGGPIAVGGDGTPLRSYLYTADLAAWLWTIHLRGAHGRAYNVGSESEVSILDLASAVAAAVEPELRVVVAGTPAPGRPPERYVPDVTRAREELGLRASVDLGEAIRRTIAWHRAHR